MSERPTGSKDAHRSHPAHRPTGGPIQVPRVWRRDLFRAVRKKRAVHRGQVQRCKRGLPRIWHSRPYCAVICPHCKEIIDWEEPFKADKIAEASGDGPYRCNDGNSASPPWGPGPDSIPWDRRIDMIVTPVWPEAFSTCERITNTLGDQALLLVDLFKHLRILDREYDFLARYDRV